MRAFVPYLALFLEEMSSILINYNRVLYFLFMNSESKSKFNLWLSEHPESFHPSDEARMFDFVNSLYETEGSFV